MITPFFAGLALIPLVLVVLIAALMLRPGEVRQEGLNDAADAAAKPTPTAAAAPAAAASTTNPTPSAAAAAPTAAAASTTNPTPAAAAAAAPLKTGTTIEERVAKLEHQPALRPGAWAGLVKGVGSVQDVAAQWRTAGAQRNEQLAADAKRAAETAASIDGRLSELDRRVTDIGSRTQNIRFDPTANTTRIDGVLRLSEPPQPGDGKTFTLPYMQNNALLSGAADGSRVQSAALRAL